MPPAPRAQQQRADRRAICALLAVFALLVQTLIPAAAFANGNAAGGMVICTATGTSHAGPADSPGRAPPAGHHGAGCDHCLCPFAAAPPPAIVAQAGAPVRYALSAQPDVAADAGLAPGRGLAAPPPPSRGPPTLTI